MTLRVETREGACPATLHDGDLRCVRDTEHDHAAAGGHVYRSRHSIETAGVA